MFFLKMYASNNDNLNTNWMVWGFELLPAHII